MIAFLFFFFSSSNNVHNSIFTLLSLFWILLLSQCYKASHHLLEFVFDQSFVLDDYALCSLKHLDLKASIHSSLLFCSSDFVIEKNSIMQKIFRLEHSAKQQIKDRWEKNARNVLRRSRKGCVNVDVRLNVSCNII